MTLVEKAAERVTETLVAQRLVESSKREECLRIVLDALKDALKAWPSAVWVKPPDPPVPPRTNI